ncbi:NACHT domain-containing protein [Burkholderia pyrrocinia]|uniref:NACHT domain-containing protein n=1 Tax=Burkholderia pyrrocinia TaxID=60550 RepID=UPI001575B303|nr:NACHT domain-containing protein [Burkholderia pyrrocinia]NTX28689.1 NACHT domain-containing protein [Burkholderia pyrrocinia]
MTVTTATVATGAKILAPLVKDLYIKAKNAGASYLDKWAVSQFPKRLAKKISKIESVKTLWQFEREVLIRDFYYPAAVSFNGGKKKVENFDDLGASTVVIEGIVGQGKSMFLRYLCIQELSESGSGRLPIFIELRSVKPGNDLMDYILTEMKTYEIEATPDSFHFLAQTGKIALLLDGFDELDNSLVSSVVNELELIVEKYEDIVVLVTSRPDCGIQKCAPFEVLRLAKIGVEDYLPFLSKLGLTRTRANEIAIAISESPNEISELIVTPLMLTLTVMVYKSENSIPPMLAEFFEALFTTVFTRHDKTKPGFERKLQTGLGERTLQKLFETFCFMCAQAGLTRSLTAEEFASTFERSTDFFTEGATKLEAFRHDVSKVACLLLEEGVGDMTFLHKSIAEYFAASFVRRLQESAAQKFYGRVRGDYHKWQEIINFLSKIDQYRYNRFFLIPDCEDFLEDFPFGASSEVGILETYLQKLTTGVSVQLAEREGTIRVQSMITVSGPPIMLERSFTVQNVMSGVVFASKLNDYGNILLRGKVHTASPHPDRKSRLEVFQMSLFEIYREIGYDPFLTSLKLGIQRVERELEMARKYVADENRKEDIF